MSRKKPGRVTIAPSRPRNPLHDHALLKKGSAHGKTRKAQRRADKISLRRGEDVKAA